MKSTWIRRSIAAATLTGCFYLGFHWFAASQHARDIIEQTLAPRSNYVAQVIAPTLDLSDPVVFADFCQTIQRAAEERERRKRKLKRWEDWTVQNLDAEGEPQATLTETLRVWYEKNEETREVTVRAGDQGILRYADAQYYLPFSGDHPAGDYSYAFEEIESIDGRPVARIRCEPIKRVTGLFAGRSWIDIESAEVLRFEGVAVHPPPLFEFLKINVECRAFTPGGMQLSFAQSEAKIPILGLHRRTRVRFRDYE